MTMNSEDNDMYFLGILIGFVLSAMLIPAYELVFHGDMVLNHGQIGLLSYSFVLGVLYVTFITLPWLVKVTEN